MSPMPSVCVLMRTKNSETTLGQALVGLFGQRAPGFELVVVDSGSTDATRSIAAQFPARLACIEASAYLPGRVLNRAIAETRAEIIVFQNSDVVPLDSEALARLLSAFDDPLVDAAFARQLPRPEAEGWVRRDYASAFPANGMAPDWMPYSLPFAAMRRSAWQKRPFYERAWGSEDAEWGHAAKRAGKTIRYVSEARVMHSHNYTLSELYGRRFIEGEADAFIHQEPQRTFDTFRRCLRAVAGDAVFHLRERDLRGLLLAPARRTVAFGAYHRGRSLGERRLSAGDHDVSQGQRTVLSRYRSGP